MSKNNRLIAVALVTSLFFIWGFALNLNPILIPHLKKACQLNNRQSSYIDAASYMAYFFLAIPAAQFMKRYGYRGGILLGLILFATGAFLFYPAAATRSYLFFLGASFVLFCGAAFLETAANPYITVLGDPDKAAFRINLSQSFNGLAASLAPYLGGIFILSGRELSPAKAAAMSSIELGNYLDKEASSVKVPYLIIGAVVLIVAVLISRTHLPDIDEQDEESSETQAKSLWVRLGDLLNEKRLMSGAVAQLFYVGAQACVFSFFILFSEKVVGLGEKTASVFLAAATLAFLCGRVSGTVLMRFISPVKILAFYSAMNVLLILLAVFMPSNFSVYALIGVGFFMSIMFPTIFSLSIRGLGAKTKLGSSFVIMGIVGGAIFPFIMGLVIDLVNVQIAYLVPAICFAYIFYFAYKNLRVKSVVLDGAFQKDII
jgi:FHS family L-fucose permease-like MFS transporter